MGKEHAICTGKGGCPLIISVKAVWKKVEAVAGVDFLRNPNGEHVLRGEGDIYLNPNIWVGVNGEYNLDTGERYVGLPLGFLLPLGKDSPFQVRIEPRYNPETGELSGTLLFDMSLRF